MASNTKPVFTKQAEIGWSAAALTAANTAKTGTGAVTTVFTAGPDGAFCQRIIARSLGTNVQTVLRVFLNNGLTNATVANNSLIAEMTLPATNLTETAALPPYELPLNFALPPGYKLNVVLGTAVVAGYQVTVLGGDYTE